jgi:outer membrane protein assembly factor BamD
MPQSRTSLTYSYFFILLALVLSACGSSDVVKNLTAEERFTLGKAKFDKGDYLEATGEFNIIKLQFPGSAVADKAQFYLGECHFMQEEFLIAAEEYAALKRNMPASSLIPLAQYKIALCYYSLDPKSALDQAYASRAIEEFQSFIEYYPAHEMVHDAEAKINELNTRLAKKLFDSANLYMKLEYYKSATLYYNSLVEKYHDTEFAEPALLGKVKSLIIRKKYREAKPEIEKFIQKYSQSSSLHEAQQLEQEINNHINDSATNTPVGH